MSKGVNPVVEASEIAAESGGVLSSLVQSLRAAGARIMEARRRKAAVHMLRHLDDRMLSDIGLSRGEIESAVNGEPAGRRRTLDL